MISCDHCYYVRLSSVDRNGTSSCLEKIYLERSVLTAFIMQFVLLKVKIKFHALRWNFEQFIRKTASIAPALV